MNSGAPKKTLKKYNDTYNAFEKKFGNKPAKDKKGGVVKKAQMGMTTKPSIPKSVIDKFKSKGEILPYRKSEQEADKKKGFEKGTYTPPKFKNKMDSMRTDFKETFGMKKGGAVKKTMKMGGKMSKMSKKK
jgi:hypothetical protein